MSATAINRRSKGVAKGGRVKRAARVVPHLSVAERVARGRVARAEVPRSSHAEYTPAPHRQDPVALLESQAESRVPELVPIRYGRMLVSPFTFYRGAALLMAADLATTPDSGLRAQLCGDAHLSNFGLFASPDRRLVFDLNDFDETLPGPWEWDVKRLAVSFEVAGRENGYSRKERRRIVQETVAAYRQAMGQFAGMRALDVWYARLEVDELLAELKKRMAKKAGQVVAKARTKDSMTAFSKLTRAVGGEPQIVSDPPLIERVHDLAPGREGELVTEALHELLRRYRETLQTDRRVLLEEYRLVDLARKVVGVGSVGTRAWIALICRNARSVTSCPRSLTRGGCPAWPTMPAVRSARRSRGRRSWSAGIAHHALGVTLLARGGAREAERELERAVTAGRGEADCRWVVLNGVRMCDRSLHDTDPFGGSLRCLASMAQPAPPPGAASTISPG
jgi:hypothetical protein